MTRAKIPGAISTVLPICERDRNRVVYEYSQPCSEGRTESRSQLLSVCQSAREEAYSMGFDQGRNENCVWLKPELVAQIEFTEWTPDGHLRHSKFVGLRDDKDAKKVVREIED